MAYRVRSEVQTITQYDPLTDGVSTYTQTPGPLTLTNPAGQTMTFQPGDVYPDWAYAIYNNPRVIETIE